MNLNNISFLLEEINIDNIINKDCKCFCGSNKTIFKCCAKKKKSIIENLIRHESKFMMKNFSMKCMANINGKKCNNETINSHSISKSANFNDKKFYSIQKRGYQFGFVKTPKNIASCFKGFCGKHDLLFSYLDKNTFCKDFVFQQYYRSLCYELFVYNSLLEEQRTLSLFCDFIFYNLKKTQSKHYEKTFFIDLKNYFEKIKSHYDINIKLKMEILETEKSIVEKQLKEDLTEKGDSLHFKIKKLNNNISFLSACIHQPKVDEQGEYFNFKNGNKHPVKGIYPNGNIGFDYNLSSALVNINVLENNGERYLIMSCRKEHEHLIQYIDKFIEMENIEGILNKQSFLFRNCYYDMDVIKPLKNDEEEIICSFYDSFDFFYKDIPKDMKFIHSFMELNKPFYFKEKHINELNEIILKLKEIK
jgi:hypothetical protein